MRADVEMLELRSEALRGRIQDGLVLVDQLEASLQQEYPNASDPEVDKQKKKLHDQQLRAEENIKVWTAAYSESRIEIAAELSVRAALQNVVGGGTR